MALQKQVVSVNLSSGLDTKTDKKHVIPGKLTKLENGVYRKGMAIEKRYGFDLIKNLSADSDIFGEGRSLDEGSSINAFNDELLQFNSQKIYSYAEGADRWVDKGFGLTAIVESKQIVNNTATQSSCDSASLNGIGVYAWEDSRGGVRASVIDETSGLPLIADTVLDNSATRPKCFIFDQNIYVFMVDTNSLTVDILNTKRPFSFRSEVVTNGIDSTDPNYDVIEYEGQILVVYNEGTDSISAWFDADFDAIEGPYASKTYASRPFTSCVTAVAGTDNDIYVLYHDGSDVKAMVLDRFGNLDSEDTIGTYASVDNITIINSATTNTASTDVYSLFYTVPGATSDVTLIYKVDYEPGDVGFPAVWLRSVGLYTRAFAYVDVQSNTRTVCLGVAHESTLQASYFVVTTDGTIIGKQQYTTGGGLRDRSILGYVSEDVTDVFTYAILKKNRIISENATIFTPTGVMQTKVDFTNADRFTAKQLGNNLIIVGGVLNMYDGQNIVEHGFLLYPERVVASAVGSGGSLADGSYQVYVVYEWTDNFGQIHRSRPSVAATVTCSAGGTASIVVTAPTLRLTRKDGTNRSDISVVGYVTDTNGSVAYRFTSISTPINNDPSADTVSLGTITAVSTSNEILYTTGDVLANDPAPACSVIEVFQNRAWLGGLEESSSINFSKENKSGFPVEFNPEFTKSVESAGGRVKALSFIDDKLVAFKADKTFITFGDGPNDTNTLGGFAELQNESVDVGCENPRSIAKIPNGIIFKSKKGFYALDTSFNSAYIGADVEGFNDLTVSSANLIPDTNEVRFTTQSSVMLTYNYYFGKWATATNLAANDAVLWKNNLVVLRNDGTIFKQNSSIYKDANAAYGIVLETGWISIGGMTAYKRIYELMILGEYKSQHKIRVKIAYNNNEAWEHSGVYDPTSEFPVEFYGDDSPYGESGTVYGGKPADYAIRVRMKRQKCSSFKVRIEELVTSATLGTQESMVISDLGIVLGLKKGVVKKPQSRNMKLS